MTVRCNMKKRNANDIFKDESGAVAIITAVVLAFVLIGIAALAIDIGRATTAKNELQNAADAAALAGAGELGRQYINNESYNENTIKDIAKNTAEANNAANADIVVDLDRDEINMGRWSADHGFQLGNNDGVNPSGPNRYNAVEVKLRKDDISTFFARILSPIFGEVSTGVVAVAALTGPGEVDPGEVNIPFALSENLYDSDHNMYRCGSTVSFSPTTEACAGWHNFFDPINASAMRQKFRGIIKGHGGELEGDFLEDDQEHLWKGSKWLDENFNITQNIDATTTPAIAAGDEFEFQGGNISALFASGGYLDPYEYDGNYAPVIGQDHAPVPFLMLFDYFRYRDHEYRREITFDSQTYDDDEAWDKVWFATIPIYKDTSETSCINPNTRLEIVGFDNVVVITPNPPPDSNVTVLLDCEQKTISERGGGTDFGGLLGVIPNLVQ